MVRSRPPKMLLLLLLVLMMASLAVVVLAAESSDSNRHGRRSGNWKGRKRATTTTTTTADPFSILGDDEDDGLGSAVAAESVSQQQDQPPGVETCEVARLKCAYRVGCGLALQNYMVGCSDVITGASQRCSDHCRNSLIALTSTDEGEALMKCKCSDAFCSESKQRIDICRSAVLKATHNSTIVSCGVAQWICMADPLCSTALDYYHRFCRSMFTGKKCTLRCKNSISILRRQEKAAKLSTCVCDGSEDYDCPSILDNMDRLCYHKIRPSATPGSGATPAHSGEGGGQGVEEQNENNKSKNHQHHHHHHHQTTNQNNNNNNNDGRTTGQNSGHHPDQSLHPHHTQKRPHPPHHPTGTNDIESNEVELHRTRAQYPTSRKPNSGATAVPSWSLIIFSLLLATGVVVHPARLAV